MKQRQKKMSAIQARIYELDKTRAQKEKILSLFLKKREEVASFILEATSEKYREYFSPMFFYRLLFIEDEKGYLEKAKNSAIAIRLFEDLGMKGLIAEFFEKYDPKFSLRENLVSYLNEAPFLEEALKMLRIIEEGYNLAEKTAEKQRHSALNKISLEEKFDGLSMALKTAPWGSKISLLIVRDYILLLAGEKVGK